MADIAGVISLCFPHSSQPETSAGMGLSRNCEKSIDLQVICPEVAQETRVDALVKSQKTPFFVIPAEAGIQ